MEMFFDWLQISGRYWTMKRCWRNTRILCCAACWPPIPIHAGVPLPIAASSCWPPVAPVVPASSVNDPVADLRSATTARYVICILFKWSQLDVCASHWNVLLHFSREIVKIWMNLFQALWHPNQTCDAARAQRSSLYGSSVNFKNSQRN